MTSYQVTYSLREIDGGTDYFSQFANSLPSDPNYFPVGVWLESVTSQADINFDKDVGLNLYVGITANSNLSIVQNNGMYAILQQNEWRTNQGAIANPAVVGWLLSDEIDMTQGPGQGYTTLNNILSTLPDDGRFRYNNYAKGVMFWETDAQAEQFVNDFQQVTSVDTYWFTDPNIDAGSEGGRLLNNGNPLTIAQTRLAANYGYTVDRMRALDAMDGERQPIWNFVEVGWPYSETAAQGGRQIAPDEIKAAVWHSIIAGAQGIIYFNHSFGGPEQTFSALRDPRYAAERAAVDSTNALIEQLAPVINSPFDDGFVTVNSSVRVMAKYYNGEHYVFAGATVNGAATSTDSFTLAGISGGTAEVIGENRTIAIVNGQFADTFADGNAIHIYHIITDAAQNTILGDNNANTLIGTSGNDMMSGLAGNDTLDGLAGTDTLAGGTGNDLYYLRSVSNTIIENAGEGTDTVVALVSGHTLAANVENGSLWVAGTLTGNGLDNVLYGNSGNDTLNGGGGNDTLDGLAGTDTLAGGTGNDLYYLRSVSNTIIENAGEGTDTVVALVSGHTLAANVENGSLWVTSGGTLTGNSLDNVLYGNSGNDTLNGGGGNDTLDGLAGTDTLAGGTGNDLYYLRSVSNTIIENAGAGTDTVVALVSGHTLAANVENGSLWVTSGGTLTGNGLDNVLYGNSGNDTLNGAGGNDTLDGLAGTDTLAGGTGNDLYYLRSVSNTIIENAGAGTDTVVALVSGHTLAANVENGSLWVAGTLTGNGLDNALYGNSGNDTLNGAGGNDTLSGLAGNDILDGGTGNDLMHGGAGNDTFVFKDVYGNDKIVDFTPGQDVVDMRGVSSLHTFADVQSHAAQVGNDTVITVDANTTLTLQGVQLSSLHQQDFLQI